LTPDETPEKWFLLTYRWLSGTFFITKNFDFMVL
jgi:hypothetical protein